MQFFLSLSISRHPSLSWGVFVWSSSFWNFASLYYCWWVFIFLFVILRREWYIDVSCISQDGISYSQCGQGVLIGRLAGGPVPKFFLFTSLFGRNICSLIVFVIMGCEKQSTVGFYSVVIYNTVMKMNVYPAQFSKLYEYFCQNKGMAHIFLYFKIQTSYTQTLTIDITVVK